MKMLISLLLAALMLLTLAACRPSSVPPAAEDPTEAPTEAPTEEPVETPEPAAELPVLSEMSEEDCVAALRALGVEIPDGLGFDIRSWVWAFEEDIDRPYPSDIYFDETHMLFEQVREAVRAYYAESGFPIHEPTPEPAAEPTPEAFVPEGCDAHDYLTLAEFFGSQVNEYTTIGEACYGDHSNTFDIEDPRTWRTDYHGVVWESGKAKELTFYPCYTRLPASLELTGFEKLEKIAIWYVLLDSVNIADCPMLDNGCMVYASDSAGEASLKAGYIGQLQIGSRSHVHCELVSETDEPFTVDLTAQGAGTVRASAVYYEEEYKVTAVAIADQYVDLIGWFDENGNLVSTDMFLELAGNDIGPASGEYRYTARFSQPPSPTPIPGGDYFCELKPNVPSSMDIDGDGEDDTVLVGVDYESEDEPCFTVTVTLASDPSHPYVLDAGNEGGDVAAAVVDFDPSDPRREIVLCYDMCDGDPVTYIFRLKEDGSGFETYIEYVEISFGLNSWYYMGIPEDYVYSADKGLQFCRRTEILGTEFVFSRLTLGKDGVEILDSEYTYAGAYPLKVKKAITVTLEDGTEKTISVGSEVTPYSTDRASYVKVKLSDGSIGRMAVTFGNNDYGYPVYLNGVNQDDCFEDIPYAD